LKRLPDKALLTTHAPAKVDERKTMIEEYLQHAITLKNVNLLALSEFLSSDRIHTLPVTLTNVSYITNAFKMCNFIYFV
jgi:hypothetical protein